jgi:hypothetical protein
MVTAIGLAVASLFIPLAVVLVVAQCMDSARWVRRKGWREPNERIGGADASR